MILETIVLGLAALGLALLLYWASITASSLLQGLRAHVLPVFQPNRVPLTVRFGTWAVVTGSTDGIGRAYALELARRGLNIVLISRTKSKLDDVAEEIMSRHLVKTKTIAVDFSKGKEVFETVRQELGNIPVGILVNNVGKQYKYPMYLGEVDQDDLWEIVNINIGATTQMTRLILPGMVERGKGAIVNVSSGSEHQPLPLMTVYAATKVYIKSFSEALRFEYRKKGITVQHLAPMFVNTKMNNFSHRLRETKLFVPDATSYARNAVNTLGLANTSSGYWAHGIQTFFAVIPPVWVRTYIGGLMNQVFRNDYYNNMMKGMKQTD